MSETITLTDSAVTHLKKTLEQEGSAIGIRLGVKNSGCSGLSYTMDFAREKEMNDKQFEIGGVKLLVDEQSFEVLKGTQLDYVMEGLNGYLKFRNPNATNECGCGESFQVKEDDAE